MGERTGIEWTDATWNPVTGCTKVSEGCRHCYAERIFPRVYPGRKFSDVQCHPERLEQPLRWRKPKMVFVNSMSDLFHEDVPTAFLETVFDAMASARQHVFQVLTKRAVRMARFSAGWPPNVWAGVSVEDQQTASERIPLLLETPAAVRIISYEPALEPVSLEPWLEAYRESGLANFRRPARPGIDWVIAGGESGPKARPADPSWFRSVRDQCQERGVAFFMKQMAKKAPIPSDLMVREYPVREAVRSRRAAHVKRMQALCDEVLGPRS